MRGRRLTIPFREKYASEKKELRNKKFFLLFEEKGRNVSL